MVETDADPLARQARAYPRRPDDRRFAKARAVIRRRLLPVLVMMIAVAASYVLLGLHEEVTYDAEAVLYVPPNSAGELPPGNQDAAVKLAKTYAAALPLNETLLSEAARRSQESVSYVSSHVAFTNDAGTSLIRVEYSGSSPGATAAVLAYFNRTLTATNPPKPVTPGSVKVVNLPQDAVARGGDIVQRFPLGISIGIVAGLALAYVLETIRPRIDTVRDCHRALGVPVTWWGRESSTRVWSWARRIHPTEGGKIIELVPADRAARRPSRAIQSDALEALDSPKHHLESTNGHRHSPAAVLVREVDVNEEGDDPLRSCVILVVRNGSLRTTAQGATEELAAQARTPNGAVLTASARHFRVVPEWPVETGT